VTSGGLEKKSRRARERDAAKRAAWQAETRGIDPDRFVWVDETGSHLGMTRAYSRAPRGQRAVSIVPAARGVNRTLLASLTLAGPGPGLLLEGAVDRDAFEAYIVHLLAPTLQAGQIVVVDNLKAHDSDRARAAIEERGATLRYLPPYSPDFNPIEEAFSKVKAFLRSAAPRTPEDHAIAVWAALRTITPADADGWFVHAGYPGSRRRPPKRPARPRPRPLIQSPFPDAPPVVTLQIPAGIILDHLW
jgi:transposase